MTEDGRIFAIDGGTGKLVEVFQFLWEIEFMVHALIFDYENKLVFAGLTQSVVYWVGLFLRLLVELIGQNY